MVALRPARPRFLGGQFWKVLTMVTINSSKGFHPWSLSKSLLKYGCFQKWVYMGVSKNRGGNPQNLMVKMMENPINPIKMDDLGGKTHYFWKPPIFHPWPKRIPFKIPPYISRIHARWMISKMFGAPKNSKQSKKISQTIISFFIFH